MTESATKQIERLATAIREMQDQGMKVNKNRLSKYMNEEKGDNISIVTVGKYFDQAIKQVNGGSSKASTSPSTSTAGDKGRSELLLFSNKRMSFGPNGSDVSYDDLSDERKKKLQGLAALGKKELIDELCLVLEFEFDPSEIWGGLDFRERFKKIELVGFVRPTAACIEGHDVDFNWLDLVYRVEYSVEYLDEIKDFDEEEREESLDETRWDLYHVLWPVLNVGGEIEEGEEITLGTMSDMSVEVINAISSDTLICVLDSDRQMAVNAATLPAGAVAQPAIWEAD